MTSQLSPEEALPDLCDLWSIANGYVNAYAHMVELNGGFGKLAIESRAEADAMMEYDDFFAGGADTALRVIERAQDAEEALHMIHLLLPSECWVLRSENMKCTELVGGSFGNGAVFAEAMCCLPCQIHAQIDRYFRDEGNRHD